MENPDKATPKSADSNKEVVPPIDAYWSAVFASLERAACSNVTSASASNTTTVRVDVRTQPEKKTEEKDKKSAAQSESEILLKELEDLKKKESKLEAEYENLGGLQSQQKKEKKAEIDSIKKEIKSKEDRLKNAQDEEAKRRQMMLRILIGAIGAIGLPLIGYISGGQLGILAYLYKMKKTESRCEKLLKEIEENENGRMNPHWGMSHNALKNWKIGSEKLRTHKLISATALVCKS